MNYKLRLIDKETKQSSNWIDLEEIIYNQNEIEFEFRDGTLPYSDFLTEPQNYKIEIEEV